jgi:beta-N-acetylhexosaminidase
MVSVRVVLLLSSAVSYAAAAPPKAGEQARRWMARLTLSEKAAQLVMAPFYGEAPNTQSQEWRRFTSLVRDLRIGGLIILNRVQDGVVKKADPYEMAAFLNRMQRLSRLPLIVGGDFERGASMRINGTPQFPHAMAFGAAGDVEATRALGRITARESRALGVHWVFAPVADVNNNPDNPIINIRAFSESPRDVARHVTAFIEGARSDPKFPVLLAVKHFPGHGDTATDSHLGLGRVTAARERLDEVELVPFKAAIGAGVDSVMTAHLAVAALEPEEIPATVSAKTLTGALREQLGFKGLISTDAMDMQGLTSLYRPGEAAVRAIEAGADLLLIPAAPQEAVRAVVEAVKQGRISKERIDRSVRRILEAKVRTGLHRRRTVDLEAIEDLVGKPEDLELAGRVAQRALTLVKNDGGALPLKEPAAACYMILGGSRFSTLGRDFQDAVKRRAQNARTYLLDPELPANELDTLARDAANCAANVIAAYVTAAAYRGDVALAGNYPAFVEKVIAAGPPAVFVSFGNPYLLRSFPNVRAYLAAFSTSAHSAQAAARALFGEIGVSGRLPVSIPGIAGLGHGLDLKPARVE